MFKSIKRIGAALVIALLVVPHFALAATMAPVSTSCLDDGTGPPENLPDNDVPDTVCGSFVDADVRDGDINTGHHIDGPDYPIMVVIDLGASYSVTELDIYHMPAVGGGGDGNRIAPSATNANNKVQYSTNGSDYSDFGTIPAYDDAADMVAEVTGSQTARYLRVWNWENYGSAAGWYLNEFVISYTPAGPVPEMGFWALLVILPIMGYVIYKSTPSSKPSMA